MDRLSLHLPLVDRVHRALLDAICEGELAPGERLTQDELALKLDVSRQPILQALLLLKRQGFVRDSGRRGVVVAPLDPVFISHLYEVRSALDGAACRGAARHGAQEAALWGGKRIEEGRAAVAAGSLHRMIAADMRFHLFLYELSGNPVIAETMALHWQHIRRVMGGYLQHDRARASIWDEHARILDAVARGAAAEAERLARRHAEAALANLLPLIADAEKPAKRRKAR